jgi:hypothetical protein
VVMCMTRTLIAGWLRSVATIYQISEFMPVFPTAAQAPGHDSVDGAAQTGYNAQSTMNRSSVFRRVQP